MLWTHVQQVQNSKVVPIWQLDGDPAICMYGRGVVSFSKGLNCTNKNIACMLTSQPKGWLAKKV